MTFSNIDLNDALSRLMNSFQLGRNILTIFSRSVKSNDFDKFVQKSVMTALHN